MGAYDRILKQWLPSSGRGTWAHLILPATSLALYRLALFIRLIRAGMLDILTMDFIRTARSKGVSERKVIYKHALKNTLIPFVTIAGMQMGSLLAGAIGNAMGSVVEGKHYWEIDQMHPGGVRTVLERLWTQAIRADELTGGATVMKSLFASLLSSDLMIADISGRNPNVMYESVPAHASSRVA